MTVLFKNIRLYGYLTVMLLSGGVLGIAAYFASIFLPNLHHDYTIFSLVPPSWTIFILALLLFNSTPRGDAFFLFISDILWLTLAAWTSDSLGSTQCDALGNARTNAKHGTISARSYCDLSKVIEAFSWATFCLLTLYFIFVFTLATGSKARGWYNIWRDDIRELPWFGQTPGYPGAGYTYSAQYGNRGYPGSYVPGSYPQAQYPTSYGGNVVQQQPGQTLVIQPGMNGGAPTVQHVPTAV